MGPLSRKGQYWHFPGNLNQIEPKHKQNIATLLQVFGLPHFIPWKTNDSGVNYKYIFIFSPFSHIRYYILLKIHTNIPYKYFENSFLKGVVLPKITHNHGNSASFLPCLKICMPEGHCRENRFVFKKKDKNSSWKYYSLLTHA
jgi:hypothetical protein